jgi:1-(5-phosphoribosyl)-5-[(5-phosphoribosylamino)methylideneamino] imidazole-4-carboxamide isomerase/N-(5'phosphoribosyl)anthranilate isomerase
MTGVPSLVLLPAVDVASGQAVRLVQGEAGSETAYGAPLDAALAWQDGGAEWVHLVDLDAAFGRGDNGDLVAEVVGRLDVAVELSGGIRDDVSLDAALATGCARVNIGTAALERPDWVRAAIAVHGERIAVGLDVRGTTLSARGWTQDGGELFEVLARLDADGCARYVVTDVRRDGTLTGPNLDLLRKVCEATDRPVVASGGFRASTTCVPSPDCCRSESRVPSSARRSTRALSRCPKRWRRSGESLSSGRCTRLDVDVGGSSRCQLPKRRQLRSRCSIRVMVIREPQPDTHVTV